MHKPTPWIHNIHTVIVLEEDHRRDGLIMLIRTVRHYEAYHFTRQHILLAAVPWGEKLIRMLAAKILRYCQRRQGTKSIKSNQHTYALSISTNLMPWKSKMAVRWPFSLRSIPKYNGFLQYQQFIMPGFIKFIYSYLFAVIAASNKKTTDSITSKLIS